MREFSKARGRAIAFLFDDNVFEPNFLAEAWDLLNKSGADVVYGEVAISHSPANKPFVLEDGPLTLDLLRGMNIIHRKWRGLDPAGLLRSIRPL